MQRQRGARRAARRPRAQVRGRPSGVTRRRTARTRCRPPTGGEFAGSVTARHAVTAGARRRRGRENDSVRPNLSGAAVPVEAGRCAVERRAAEPRGSCTPRAAQAAARGARLAPPRTGAGHAESRARRVTRAPRSNSGRAQPWSGRSAARRTAYFAFGTPHSPVTHFSVGQASPQPHTKSRRLASSSLRLALGLRCLVSSRRLK